MMSLRKHWRRDERQGRNAISAHAVTPVSFKTVGGRTDGIAALSPVQSADDAGFFGSSSGKLKTIFISPTDVGDFVKIPPQFSRRLRRAIRRSRSR